MSCLHAAVAARKTDLEKVSNEMRVRTPSPVTMMLATTGLFILSASAATFFPAFVHDRVSSQFTPVWEFLASSILGVEPNDSVIHALAVVSQVVIGISELVIGSALLFAVTIPAKSERRRQLAGFAIAYAMGLFGVFLVTMFVVHDPNLPEWNQYPPLLIWFGVIWLAVEWTDGKASVP